MTRPENFEFQEWWNKQRERNHDFLLEPSPDNPNFLTVEITSPTSDQTVEKGRARSARQLSWVCLLRFQQIFSSLAYLTNGVVSLFRIANRRIFSHHSSSSSSSSSRLYRVIKAFLILVLILLSLELVAYFKGWHFRPPAVGSEEVLGMVGFVYAKWLEIRSNYLAPPLQSLTNVCIVLFLIQSVDRIALMLGCFWIKFRRLKPAMPLDEKPNAVAEDYPMVLVQIPMCNEREVSTCRFHLPFVKFVFLFNTLELEDFVKRAKLLRVSFKTLYSIIQWLAFYS